MDGTVKSSSSTQLLSGDKWGRKQESSKQITDLQQPPIPTRLAGRILTNPKSLKEDRGSACSGHSSRSFSCKVFKEGRALNNGDNCKINEKHFMVLYFIMEGSSGAGWGHVVWTWILPCFQRFRFKRTTCQSLGRAMCSQVAFALLRVAFSRQMSQGSRLNWTMLVPSLP